MALVVAETLKTSNGVNSTQVLNTAAGTAAGDTLVIFYGSDFYSLATMPEVTSSAGACAAAGVVDVGDSFGHIKGYICPITSGGSKSITIPAHVDCDIFGIAMRISSTATVDGSPTGQIDTSNTLSAHVAPEITTTVADALLCCCWLKTNAGSGWTGEQYTVPGSMTKRAEASSSPFSAMAAATETIASPGATGTRTATWFEPKVYGALTLAVAGTAAATSDPRLGYVRRRRIPLLVR